MVLRPILDRMSQILVDRPHLLPPQRLRRHILDEPTLMPLTEPLLRTDPDIPRMIFEQAANAEVHKTILHRQLAHSLRCQIAQTLVGTDPHLSPASLEKPSHKIVRKLARCRVVHGPILRDAKSAATIGANPQIAFMVAKYIPHQYPRAVPRTDTDGPRRH